MRNLSVLYVILFVASLVGIACVSGVSMYAGSSVAESRWQKEKLDYEQRLGTETARSLQQAQDYSAHFNVLAAWIKQTQQDVADLRTKFDREAIRRDRASAAAIAAAEEASQKAASLGKQLSAQQQVIVAKTTEAVNAAKATEKKLDTATLPAAVVPAHPCGK